MTSEIFFLFKYVVWISAARHDIRELRTKEVLEKLVSFITTWARIC